MELTINDRIRNRKINFFNNFTLKLQYDSVGSAFSFSFYFNPENQEHKEVMCIGHFHKCIITHNNETLLTGIILSQDFSHEAEPKMVTISGYSLPGVLEDCEIPTSLYPLQSDGLSLRQVASKLIQPFGLSLTVDSSVASLVDASFTSTTASESQSIKAFLSELASQKNVVISHDEFGNLLFTKSKTNLQPIIDFDVPKGSLPGTSMNLKFDGQQMHSHITVQKQASEDEGTNAAEYTIRNPFVIGSVYRPKVISQSSGDDNDTEKAAKTALSAELKNIKLTIVTDRWVVDGKILKPNNIITVKNPQCYLFDKTKWFIESIDYTGNNEINTAVLNCVLPCVYDGSTPEYLWKGINLH